MCWTIWPLVSFLVHIKIIAHHHYMCHYYTVMPAANKKQAHGAPQIPSWNSRKGKGMKK